MSVHEDILEMIRLLQHDKKFSPMTMYYADAVLLQMGYDPNDYPELEGYPSIRVVSSVQKR